MSCCERDNLLSNSVSVCSRPEVRAGDGNGILGEDV